jgi:hypothetical protein
MAQERTWPSASQLFTANGLVAGVVSVADSYGFYEKQIVSISSNTQPSLSLEVKRIDGPTSITVGPAGSDMSLRADLTAYLVADYAKIFAAEQSIKFIKPDEIHSYEFERSPIKAIRSYLVDKYGRPYGVVVDSNGVIRLPVDANISVGDLHVNISNPKTPTIANISVPTANIEQSYTFPTNTKRFSLKVREGNSRVQIAYISGQSSTNFYTINYGNSYESGDVDPNYPFTIYFQCSQGSKTLEVLSWAI